MRGRRLQCRNLGASSKPDLPPQSITAHRLGVQFTSTLMPGLPWEIRPLQTVHRLHPGELRTTLASWCATCQTRPSSARPLPACRPLRPPLQRLDCFASKRQTLARRPPGLTFIVDGDARRRISELTTRLRLLPAESIWEPAAGASPASTAAPRLLLLRSAAALPFFLSGGMFVCWLTSSC